MTDAPPHTAPPPLSFAVPRPPSAPAMAVDRHPPRRAALAAVVVGAAGTDLAMWTTGPGLAWTLGATAAAVAVYIGARPRRPVSLVLLALVPVLAVWCWLRTSPWLLVPDLIAINLCLLLGADVARRGAWLDQSWSRLIVRLVSFAEDLALGPAWLLPALRRRRAEGAPARNWAPVLAGLALGVPLVLALGLLLASADAVFASFFDVGLEPSVVVRHVLFVGGGALVVAALLRRAAATTEVTLSPAAPVAATVPAADASSAS